MNNDLTTWYSFCKSTALSTWTGLAALGIVSPYLFLLNVCVLTIVNLSTHFVTRSLNSIVTTQQKIEKRKKKHGGLANLSLAIYNDYICGENKLGLTLAKL